MDEHYTIELLVYVFVVLQFATSLYEDKPFQRKKMFKRYFYDMVDSLNSLYD